MTAKVPSVVPLSQLVDGQEADAFILLARKEELKTREGKAYWRVTFRDPGREVTFPIWNDSPLAESCRSDWRTGVFYKVRAVYRSTNFGPQLDIKRIRAATDEDRADGFDPLALTARSRFEPEAMFAELLAMAQEKIHDPPLAQLVAGILTENRDTLLELPAGKHHHDFRGGFLEHILSVARNAVFLAEKYGELYPAELPQASQDLVVAGAILHDIGKLIELQAAPSGAEFTPRGELIGHIVLGRDIVRDAASRYPLPAELLLRLENIIISHQRTPEWGAPKPPMTPEALLVFYADDVDARLQMMIEALQGDTSDSWITSKQNALGQRVFKGLQPQGQQPQGQQPQGE
jgi:3'-5' exoribonuclease